MAAPATMAHRTIERTVTSSPMTMGEARCGWGGARAVLRRPGLASCSVCGSSTTHPWPSDDELDRAYLRYRPPSGRFSAGGDRLLDLSRSRLARRIDRIAPPGPVLDVGAGEGALVRALLARDREALGL